MQRQLLQISDRIPDDILLTLLKCFAQILSREPEESAPVSGPFIRAFCARDENVEEQKQNGEEVNNSEDDNECTFNYKVSNVVTQEVVYSMGEGSGTSGNQEENLPHDDHEMPELVDPDVEHHVNLEDAAVEEKFEEIVKENENVEEAAVEEQLENTENQDTQEEAIAENVEAENPENSEPAEQEQIENQPSDSEQPQIDEASQPEEEKVEVQEEKVEEPQPQEERPVMPMQTVSLDDIQREIHEMQMFLFNKGMVPEQKVKSHHIHKKLKKLEDSFKVDFCVNLKKRGPGERSSRSKAILANYVNDQHHGKHSKAEKEKRTPIFDPNVPNTPEDFLKEKSVSEKINKKKQKIKHLDVSWQKLCDSQKKVYK